REKLSCGRIQEGADPIFGKRFGLMKRSITDASRMTAIRKLSPFLIVCRIGNLNCQFGWSRGSLKRKNLLVAEAEFEPTNSGASSFCPNASEFRPTPSRDQDK